MVGEYFTRNREVPGTPQDIQEDKARVFDVGIQVGRMSLATCEFIQQSARRYKSRGEN